MDFAGMRSELARFSEEQAREWYLLQSGQKESPDLAAIYVRYPHLCQRRQVEQAQAATAAAADPEEQRRARHFLQFFVRQYAGNLQKEKSEAMHRLRMGLRVQTGDGEVPFHYAQVLLASEPDREKRRELSRRLEVATVQHLNPLAEEMVLDSHAIARDLGYASYVDLWDQVKGLQLARLLPHCERILAETAELARAALAADLDRYLGLDLPEAETHDYGFLTRARPFDPCFPGEGLVETLERALLAMGIDLRGQRHIRLDLEHREKKSARAFCSAIRIPDEVVLVIRPRGGQDDYHSLFHEAGHAEHFGHVDPSQPFEFARLGDISVSEVYAFLFQHLLHDPAWLAEYLPMPAPVRAEYRRFALRQKLLLVRRYCGKLRYELQLHATDQLAPMAGAYARELQAATCLPYRAAYFLTDLDPGFYSAEYLRAWIAEAQLRQHLMRQFGRRWWASPEAGRFLRSLWAWGNRYNAVELVQMLGYDGLDPGPLVAEFTEGLGA